MVQSMVRLVFYMVKFQATASDSDDLGVYSTLICEAFYLSIFYRFSFMLRPLTSYSATDHPAALRVLHRAESKQPRSVYGGFSI